MPDLHAVAVDKPPEAPTAYDLILPPAAPAALPVSAAPAVAVKKRIDSLQSIRLFASLGVFQYHLWNNYLGIPFGHPGTDFFLALVGFVAALTQARRIPRGGWRSYMLSRFVRLYVTFVPLFLVTLAFKWDEATLDWAIRSFLFIPIPDGRYPVIGATWMLSNFMLFYWVFSLAFVLRRESLLVPLFLAWAAGITVYNGLGWRSGLPAHWDALLFSERNLDMLMGYAAGVLVRGDRVSLPQARWSFRLGLLGVVVGTVLLNLGFEAIRRSLYLGLPIVVFILGAAALERRGASNPLLHLLTRPWMVWLGGTSYVLYLSHSLFLQGWSRLLPVTPALVPLIIIGALIAAVIGTRFWEQPLLKRLHSALKLD